MALFMLWLMSLCLADQKILPNRSFEMGDASPEGWSLSGGTGTWEETGSTGNRSISVTGTGEDSNYWRCDNYELAPENMFRISFDARVAPDSSDGTVIAGSSVANRDYSVGTKWENHNFIFTTPTDTTGAYLRFGQWQKSGKVWFDNIEIKPVMALHRQQDGIDLGAGEIIQSGKYKARADLRGEGSNSSRILHSHTAGFNSYRWTMGNNAVVIYRHKVGNYIQNKASVTLEIGHYTGGKCIVEASNDGSKWLLLGELSKLTHETFAVPENFFPAEEIFVRMRAEEKNGQSPSLQIYGYSYEAELNGDSIPDMMGDTKYLDILAANDELDVSVLSLGDLKPGGDNIARLEIKNNGASAISLVTKLSIAGDEQAEYSESANIPGNASRDVTLEYETNNAGDFELLISVSEENGEPLHVLRSFFNIPQLYAANYGYLLIESEECSLWWAEGTHKISKERPLPDEKADEIYINAAKNEYEPFQLVLRPDMDMENISIKVEDLANSDGQAISKDNIDISLVNYVYVKVPTDKVGCVGYWPDPLPPYKKPFSVDAGQNQPIWFTVYVPADTPAGDYNGKLTVSSGDWSQQAKLHLHVWDFSLTKETHVRSALGFSPGNVKKYHHLETDEEYREVLDKYYRNFAEHRISPYDPMALDPIKVEFISADPVEVKVDFEAFDRSARRYFDEFGLSSLRLRLQGMGRGTFHSRRLGEILGYKQGTPEHEAMFTNYLGQIQDHLEANGWLDNAFAYWFDEPSPRDYEFVRDGMDLIHRAAPKLTRLLTEQPEEELYGSVDLWCPITNAYRHETAEERRKEGESFWWYVCTGPKEPFCTLFTDHYATELRVWLWQTWKYKVEGILVWQTNYWTSPLVFPDPTYQNPYEDPMSYQTGYGRPVGYIGYWGNGDGRFLYPPLEAMEDKEAKCLLEPVSSIRWEMIREGIEDYEYFWLLADKVKKLKDSGDDSDLLKEAEELLNVPEAVTKSMTEFTIDPQPIYAHREKMAQMIEKLK